MFAFHHNCWFIRKVLRWRAVSSILCSVLLLPAVTALLIFLIRFTVFHHTHWLSGCFSLFTEVRMFFSVFLLCAVVTLLAFFNLQYYTVVPSVPCSRVSLLAEVLHPRQCVHSLVHCAVGMLVMWCVCVLAGGRYHTLHSPCTHRESGGVSVCLNEYHVFMLLAGAFLGYSHSLMSVVQNLHYVSFHIIQQYKYMRFKGSVWWLVKCSAVQSVYSVRNYVILYFFFGRIPRTWISNVLKLHVDSSVGSLDSFAGLCDVSLFYQLWISGTFLFLIWYLTVLLFRIYVTEPYSFPVQSSFAEDAEECLPKVLTEKSALLMKFLALQDLALLSQHSPARRQEVFSLSQPGGHPHNWNAISKECVSLLSDLTQRLVAHHDAVAANGRAKPPSERSDRSSSSSCSVVTSGTEDLPDTPRRSAPIRTPGSVFGSAVRGVNTPLTAPFTPELTTSFSSPAVFCSPTLRPLFGPQTAQRPWLGSVQSPHVTRRNPKLWSTSTDLQTNGSPPPSPETAHQPADEQKPSFLSQWLRNRREQVKGFIAKRGLVVYLFNKLPEASSQALFADTQAHIWALEGLSHLVAASYSEDKYGVVQTTLPSILGCMLSLQEAVDRHFKLPHASSKPGKAWYSLGDSAYKSLRFALRATLKTAIYRITSTFGEHLHGVSVPAEQQKRLQQFLEYKE